MNSYHYKKYSCLFFYLIVFFLLSGCNEKLVEKLQEKPLIKTSSKDFWIDRCDIKYRERSFPISGDLSDVVKIFGNYDRFSGLGNRYFWDDIGLQVTTDADSNRVVTTELLLNHEESPVEMSLRLADRPEDRVRLTEIKESRPQGFFRGELVIEGALIGQEVDFDKINNTRLEYLKTQDGPDAELKPIQLSWSETRYAYERTCADGKHVRFIFTLMMLEEGKPLRLEAVTIGSDNSPE